MKPDMKPDRFDASEIARQWWLERDCRLPGEGGITVFEVAFWDGCRYVGYMDAAVTNVFECVDDLVASPIDERRSVFVADHCARMGSVVRCIASNLEISAAAELREDLVSQAPDGVKKLGRGALAGEDCFLAETVREPVRRSFAEWAKTREKGGSGGSVSYGFPLTSINGNSENPFLFPDTRGLSRPFLRVVGGKIR